jgi:hypothetical protein
MPQQDCRQLPGNAKTIQDSPLPRVDELWSGEEGHWGLSARGSKLSTRLPTPFTAARVSSCLHVTLCETGRNGVGDS